MISAMTLRHVSICPDGSQFVFHSDVIFFKCYSTRQGYENLLRDLLTCLAKKYRIEEQCGSSQVKHEIWRQLTNEYLQVAFLVLPLNGGYLL